MIGEVLFRHWAETGRHRSKIIDHAINAALSLLAVDRQIDLTTVTVILASDPVARLIATVQALANVAGKTIDDVAVELCEYLHTNETRVEERPN